MEDFEIGGLRDELSTELHVEENYSTFNAEKKFMVAIINRAIKDIFSGDGKFKEEATDWFKSDEFYFEDGLSFAFICHALNIDREKFVDRLFSIDFKYNHE